MSMAEALRHIAADLAVVKHKVECLPELVRRIDTLEKNDAKRTAWAAGAGAVVSAVFTGTLWMLSRMHLLILALALVTAGCAQVPILVPELAEAVVPPPMRWSIRPVSLLMDDKLPEECKRVIEDALMSWVDIGVDYVTLGSISGIRLRGRRLGEIHVRIEDPSEKFWLASTGQYAYQGEMLYADIHFRDGFCLPVVAVHEIGHALGLPDIEAPGNVMNWSVEGMGNGLSGDQLAQVL